MRISPSKKKKKKPICAENVASVLDRIAGRYVRHAPAAPVTFRAYMHRGILRGGDYRYEADFNTVFPDARNQQCVYAWSRFWSDEDAERMFDINCFGPVIVMINGEEAWRSDIFSERYPEQKNRVTLRVRKGWNQFLVRAKKTPGGFGWILGSWLGKHPYVFMMPSVEREGQEGWLFTDPMDVDLPVTALSSRSEAASHINWYPKAEWTEKTAGGNQFVRLYASMPGRTAVGWTRVTRSGDKGGAARITGIFNGAATVYVDDDIVFTSDHSCKVDAELNLEPGPHDVMVMVKCIDDAWGFECQFTDAAGPISLESACDLQGHYDPWMYTGPFDDLSLPEPNQLSNLNQPVETCESISYWRIDAPDMWVRMYNENPMFGRWNYPLGVTVYGLLAAAREMGSEDLLQYVTAHVQRCCSTFEYAMWDREQFGGATHVHRLLASIDSLDDCGSFGSCMLEAAEHLDIRGSRAIAVYVADYIRNQQSRMPDGTFCRRKMMHEFHEDTMWADDLYMSVPFLCRFYRMSGDTRYLDDAAEQFIGFRERLYMPDVKLLSHVYDLHRDMATGVPWGRGNGWSLFSLAELLEILPDDHPRRDELLNYFREHCAGVLPLQDEDGMWHQVLTHPDAYQETSGTAMFIYAFSRGIRNGWLQSPGAYHDAVLKAWDGLTRIAVDDEGNVHGVCRGSEFSFTPDYYKYDLLPRLNDIHGIGIVLLAGVEICRLRAFDEEKGESS